MHSRTCSRAELLGNLVCFNISHQLNCTIGLDKVLTRLKYCNIILFLCILCYRYEDILCLKFVFRSRNIVQIWACK